MKTLLFLVLLLAVASQAKVQHGVLCGTCKELCKQASETPNVDDHWMDKHIDKYCYGIQDIYKICKNDFEAVKQKILDETRQGVNYHTICADIDFC